VQTSDERGEADTLQNGSGAAITGQTQRAGRQPARQSTPGDESRDDPLAGDGRAIKNEFLLGPDARKREEFLQPKCAAPGHDNSKKEEDQPEVPRHRLMRTLSRQFLQDAASTKFLYGGEQEGRSMAIIKAQYSEVWLDRFRETYGDGQGSGLSGQAESRDAGLNITAPATAN